MKKICAVMILALLWVPGAFADEVSETLAGQASERIQESTRAMIEAGIDNEKAIDVTRAMLRNRFSEEHTLRAQEIMQSTRRQELPVEPVMNKAYEGIAKNVRTESVLRAMVDVRTRYAYAYEHAATLTQDRSRVRAIGEAIADSLAAGVAQVDCDSLMTRLREKKQDRTHQQVDLLAEEVFTTTRAMARIGVSSVNLTDMVTESLRNRYTVGEMIMLRERFMEHALSREANRLAREYAARIGQGERAEDLRGQGLSGTGTGKSADGTGSGGAEDRGSGAGGNGGDSGGPGGESGDSGNSGGAGGSDGDSGGPGGGGGGSGSGGSGGRQ